jgi:flagellar motor switch protein FliG
MKTSARNGSDVEIPGIRKAAMLLVLIGDQASAAVLRELKESEVHSVVREVARLESISGEYAESLLTEFFQLSVARDSFRVGGAEYAGKMLVGAFGADAAKNVMEQLGPMEGDDANLDRLQNADPQQLAKFITNEHPQTIALMLSHLNAGQAAALLASLPSELRANVALRMAGLDQISPEIVNKIASVIGQKLQALGEFSRESYGGVRAVAQIFNRLDGGTVREILDVVDQQNPNLAETIRQLMFTFEDLLAVDENQLKEILARVDRKLLTIALKGTSDALKGHFFSIMSARGVEMLKDDMESLGPVKIKEVEAAQQQITAVVRQLEDDGVVSLKGSVSDQYVV